MNSWQRRTKLLMTTGVLIVALTPSQARAEGFVVPYVGTAFGSSCDSGQASAGAFGGFMGAGTIGGSVHLGINAGAGVEGYFSNHVGIGADMRYVRGSKDPDRGIGPTDGTIAVAVREPTHHLGLSPYVILIVPNIADVWTTKNAMDRGAVEGSPLMPSARFTTIVLNKLIWVGSITAAVHLLDRRGHRHWARGLAFLGGGAAGFAAWHNVGVNGQTPR